MNCYREANQQEGKEDPARNGAADKGAKQDDENADSFDEPVVNQCHEYCEARVDRELLQATVDTVNTVELLT